MDGDNNKLTNSHEVIDVVLPIETITLNTPLITERRNDNMKVYRYQDPAETERSNLLNVMKLIIKELLDSSLRLGRMLEDNNVPLQQFFVVLEHILCHRLKPKKGILREKRDFWNLLECIEQYAPEASDITTSVREMSNIKTSLGRARAWIRLSLMQKKLSEYFALLLKNEEILLEFYEAGAILRCDEATVIEGLLVGLNVIDCNLCVKEEDLDQPMGVIDFSLYLKEKNQLESFDNNKNEDGPSTDMSAILDQKNYLEELNRHLNATVTNLQQKNETLQTSNTLLKEDLAISKNSLLRLQEENVSLRQENENLSSQHLKELERARHDLDTERRTYETSRVGLNDIYSDAKKKLDEETASRLEIEKELDLQIGMKQEMEMALRLLEKDIHVKQDTIISLRNQLDDIKAINLQVYQQSQSTTDSLKHKTEMVAKLEEKTNQLVATMKDMERRLKESESQKNMAIEKIRQHESNQSTLETDIRIEREWRTTLQKQIEAEKEKVSRLQLDNQRFQDLEKEYSSLQVRHISLQETCDEHEKTLTELGAHLSVSKMKVEDLREATQMKSELQWTSDRDASTCKQCEKPFSVSRRKHHCRNCGDIYCNECSDNKMPHPSSSKPVRVCDHCNALLLQRYSAS